MDKVLIIGGGCRQCKATYYSYGNSHRRSAESDFNCIRIRTLSASSGELLQPRCLLSYGEVSYHILTFLGCTLKPQAQQMVQANTRRYIHFHSIQEQIPMISEV